MITNLPNNCRSAAHLFTRAGCAEDVFGSKESDIKEAYRALSRICHPDISGDHSLWYQLSQWKKAADSKVSEGRYGDKTPAYGLDYTEVPLDTGRYKIQLTGKYGEGMVSTVHRAHMPHLSDKQAPYFKVARNHQDNDLIDREWRNLRIITAKGSSSQEEFLKKQRSYVPYPVSQLVLRTADGRTLRCNALNSPKGQALTLEQLKNLAQFKDGIPRVHAYWIARQLLLTLYMAHYRGIGHGGVTPAQVLVYPEGHGTVLLGWTASYLLGSEKPPVIDKTWHPMYPADIKRTKTAGNELDLGMWAQTVLWCCYDYPAPLIQLLEECAKGRLRSTDASKLYDEFGAIIERTDGPRKFSPFEL